MALAYPVEYMPDEEKAPAIGSSQGHALLILFIVFTSLVGLLLLTTIIYCVIRVHRRLSDDELMREEENQAYLELNLEEQELYFQSKDFLQANAYLRGELTLSQNLNIQEKGIKAWEFVKDPMLTNNDLLIVSKYELNFFKNFECSAQTNLPIPQTNEVYYFESKIYSLPRPEETTISIGIGIKPYPWFRLPGRHAQSISYDSDGFRRHNQPFKFECEPPFPKLIEGDVVGIGYRVRSGTVFFTRNGKKVSELRLGGHIKSFKIPHDGQIFPIIGANNLCSVHVNVGQLGYVFIEGNVKKWGFAPLEGTGPAPPAYNKFNGDILLERSEIDDDNDLADRVNDFPPDFWDVHAQGEFDDRDKFSYNAYSDDSVDERITMESLIPNMPPSYDSDLEISEQTQGPSADLQGEHANEEGTDEVQDSAERDSEAQDAEEQVSGEQVSEELNTEEQNSEEQNTAEQSPEEQSSGEHNADETQELQEVSDAEEAISHPSHNSADDSRSDVEHNSLTGAGSKNAEIGANSENGTTADSAETDE